MFSPSTTKIQLRDIIDGMSDLEFCRFRYCQEMAGTYLAVGLFEHMLTAAMHMCDKVKLATTLGQQMTRWEESLAKQTVLQGQTLGSLIKILERQGVATSDINYLKWVKDKRDYFIHRLFHDGAWPGEMDEEECQFMMRKLIAIQLVLSRAEKKIWLIFERAGFVELARIRGAGLLAMNIGLYDALPTI